jgi:beta-phosphoglucomutase-like phosphatase (HAD superfamily)
MKFEAILFDCDGVLAIEANPSLNGVLRDLLEESGWSLRPPNACACLSAAPCDERVLIENQHRPAADRRPGWPSFTPGAPRVAGPDWW